LNTECYVRRCISNSSLHCQLHTEENVMTRIVIHTGHLRQQFVEAFDREASMKRKSNPESNGNTCN